MRALIKNNFEKQFPAIIKVVVKYVNSVKGEYQKVVAQINRTLLSIVIRTMTSKGEFQYIFTELKKHFKEAKTVSYSK